MKIITEHVNPPIPARFWDWRAFIEGREENRKLYGWGQNEALAVVDLLEAFHENCEGEETIEFKQAYTEFWKQRKDPCEKRSEAGDTKGN